MATWPELLSSSLGLSGSNVDAVFSGMCGADGAPLARSGPFLMLVVMDALLRLGAMMDLMMNQREIERARFEFGVHVVVEERTVKF
jgi:hypothetical protein